MSGSSGGSGVAKGFYGKKRLADTSEYKEKKDHKAGLGLRRK